MAHKQDRHNCSLMINLKLFLSDLSRWRVHLSGCHVPIESNVLWEPPAHAVQRIDEDVRDVLLSNSDKASSSQIHEILARTPASGTLTKKKIGRFVTSLKKRRKVNPYSREGIAQIATMHNDQQVTNAGQREMPVIGQRDLPTIGQRDLPDIGQRDVALISAPRDMTVVSGHYEAPVTPTYTIVPSFSSQSRKSTVDGNMVVYEVVSGGNTVYYNQSMAPGPALLQPSESSTVATTSSAVVYTQPLEVIEVSHNARQEQDLSHFGDLGALIMAAYQQPQQ